jgi:hypothetical protein
MRLTSSQADVLKTVHRNGPTRYNGLMRRPLAKLEGMGLITVDYEIGGLASAHTWDIWTAIATARGNELAAKLIAEEAL